MGHAYKAVGWNRQKRIYDMVLWGGIALYLALFMGIGAVTYPEITAETLLVRGLATCAFVLLHVILSIGPLARLDSRFLPLLYNRRHLGVSMFVLALAHAGFAILQFHGFGVLNPIVSILVGDSTPDFASALPFQPLGLLALIILFVMAATSHDFWLAQLTAPFWKKMHMLVYIAYALLIAHVAFGIIQDVSSPVPVLLLAIGAVWIVGIHLVAGVRERQLDREHQQTDGFVDVCAVSEMEENRAVIATISGDRVAVFRYDGQISAVSNVCQHQNGPLGEGQILDGFVTCPWHGYQYCPRSGTSPPPFTEKLPTFDVRLEGDRVLVSSKPNPAGTETIPARIPGQDDA